MDINSTISNIFNDGICIQHNNTQYNDIQHNDIQHDNIQHNDIQHNNIQHNDIQHDNIQHNDLLYQMEEMNKLSIEINNLFLNNLSSNSFLTLVNFNYNFKKENPKGFIEYKRTISSYANAKIDKLIRQIYWRIYEGLITTNTKLCYYIIGLEDSGIPSYLSKEELEKSMNIILIIQKNTGLKLSYLFLHNDIQNYDFVIIKFLLDDNIEHKIEYF